MSTTVTMLRGRIGSVVRVTSGNFLEMYDFQIFGYYAAAIAATFFPSANAYASLMAALTTFGAGFLMRPLGAVVLGSYIDHHGRRAGLLLTLGLMGLGTLSIAVTPSYAAIGVIAPLLVLCGRLVQGLSAGAENGGVSVYLYEIAPHNQKGWYVSWQTASQQIAVMTAAILGLILTRRLSGQEMTDWGWRIPLLFGCLVIPLLFFLRRSLAETNEFITQMHRPSPATIIRGLFANWRVVVLGIMLVTANTVFYYMITAYTPTFGSSILRLGADKSLLVTMCVGASNFFWVPVMGAVSDRIGRSKLLVAPMALTILTAYPVLWWLGALPSFARLLTVELWFSFLFGTYNGAMVVFLTEIMPREVRTSGFCFAYSCATAVFGGFTPAICTYLIHVTANRAAPGLWLSFAAIWGLSASLFLTPERVARITVGPTRARSASSTG